MAVPVSVLGDPSAPLTYTVPGSTAFVPRAASATFDGSGAAGSFLPSMTWLSQSGEILGRYTAPEVAAGSSAEVSWFPRGRRRVTTVGPVLDYNVGEIANEIRTTLGTTCTATATYQDIRAGDGILVLALAPSVPSVAAPVGLPVSVIDSAGNSYTSSAYYRFEANPPNVNEGMSVAWFFCTASQATISEGVGTVTAVWDNPVYDRMVRVWAVHHSGGANSPTELNFTINNDAAVYASNQVTLPTTDFLPARDQALEWAFIVASTPTDFPGYSYVAGFNGFYQAQFRGFFGSKQRYFVNTQTHGANAYLIAGAVPAPYEDDLGVLPGGTFVFAFNGVGQSFTNGANHWKGIILLGLD